MKEGKKLIVAIGRTVHGSGGSEIGARLDAELGIHFYDKNILRMNSDQSGIKGELITIWRDEKAGNKLLYKIVKSLTPEKGSPSFGLTWCRRTILFQFQSEVIRKLAAEGELCYHGALCRLCAGGRGRSGKSIPVRGYGIPGKGQISDLGYYEPRDIRKNIKRIDRERRDYHRYYTGRDWEKCGELRPDAEHGIPRNKRGAMETCAHLRIKEYEL